MGVLLTLIAGLVIWVVLWAIGSSGFDAALVTLLIMVVAGCAHVLVPHLPGRGGEG
jgi:hypothetical protein